MDMLNICYKNKNKFFNKPHLFIKSLLLFFSTHSFAQLSAQTNGFIQGNPPNFINDGLAIIEDSLGVMVNGDYYPSVGQRPMILPADIHFSDVVFDSRNLAQLIDCQYCYDEDGDKFAKGAISIVDDSIQLEWRDSHNRVITDLAASMGSACQDNYAGPYSLKITAQIKLETQFGYPKAYLPAVTIKRHQVSNHDNDFCYITPRSHWRNDRNGPEYVAYKGFMIDPGPGKDKFPTVAFPHAMFRFTLVKGAQFNDYQWDYPQDILYLDKKYPGWFFFSDTIPQGGVDYTITATPKTATKPISKASYTFRLKSERYWFEPLSGGFMFYDARHDRLLARDACDPHLTPEQVLPSRAELTDSLANHVPAGVVGAPWIEPGTPNQSARGVGKGVIGEWGVTMGEVEGTTYPKSNWNQTMAHYWTYESHGDATQPASNKFTVFPYGYGQVFYTWANSAVVNVVCVRK